MRRIALLLPLAFATSVFADAVVLKGHTRDVNAVACSADGGLVVSGGEDGGMVLWDMSQRQRSGTTKSA